MKKGKIFLRGSKNIWMEYKRARNSATFTNIIFTWLIAMCVLFIGVCENYFVGVLFFLVMVSWGFIFIGDLIYMNQLAQRYIQEKIMEERKNVQKKTKKNRT